MDVLSPASGPLEAVSAPLEPTSLPGPNGAAQGASKRLHLPFLDGIRALMALYVVHHHIMGHVGWNPGRGKFPIPLRELGIFFTYGHYPVVVFIVLSGYCLMLPAARSAEGTLKGGFGTYIRRRARRILPPYYFALAFTFIVVALLPMAIGWKKWSDLPTVTSWLSHLFLVHNLTSYVYDGNGAMWSIATEWQIYFFFPLLLLPVWRRWGNWAAVLTGSLIGLALWALIPAVAMACPWFLGLFAMGMAGATINFRPAYVKVRDSLPWVWLGLVSCIIGYLLARNIPQFSWYSPYKQMLAPFPVVDFLIGFGALCAVVHGTKSTLEARKSRFVAFFGSRPLEKLGSFSYSLYLIHAPVLGLFAAVLRRMHEPPHIKYLIFTLIFMPVCIGLSYLFFLVCEKPFLNSPDRTSR